MRNKEYTDRIDEIDGQIAALYGRRMELVDELARVKRLQGAKVLDRSREQLKLTAMENLVSDEYAKFSVRELFEQILAAGRKREYQILTESEGQSRLPFFERESLDRETARVVYQGAPGSYSQAAMKRFFGPDTDNFAVQTFRDVMIAIEEGAADYGVLPIENSTAGIVSQIYDLLVEFENYIVGEQTIKIEHCLLGVEGSSLESIRTVYSHAQSLMQSERYLNGHPDWRQISMQNNAFAARKVAEEQMITQAAIASEYAAQTYGLKILEKGINQAENNSTRFIIVTNRKMFVKDAGRISLCLELAHRSGSLYHLLSHIIYNGLNMTKIESRPIEDRTFEYRFFIDFEGNLKDPAVRNALRGLRDESRSLKILGNY